MGLSLRKKALFLAIACMPLSVVLADGDGVTSENVVPFAYGDMDNWIVREIHESGIIGGNTKWLYELGPSDTIVGNTAFRNMGGSPWATSNVMAKVAGGVETNTSVFPEKRGDGMCARMETRYESVKVFGLVDIEVIAAGSVFLGTVHEPVSYTQEYGGRAGFLGGDLVVAETMGRRGRECLFQAGRYDGATLYGIYP